MTALVATPGRRRIPLALAGTLVLIGVWAAGSLAWEHRHTGEACPIMMDVLPACYVALSGYVLMLLGMGMPKSLGRWTFLIGWLIATGLAAVASAAELWVGDVCPRSESGIPLCYFSLAMGLATGFLFRLSLPRKSKRV